MPSRLKRFVAPREFAAAARRGDAAGLAVVTDGANGNPTASDNRKINFILSDSSVARDGNTIATGGWELNNYLRNPVVLWAHQDDEPPVGRMAGIWRQGDQLRGTVEFAEPGAYPFADTIFQLTKGGFVNAVSVSWLPLEWKFATSADRAGGIDFLRQELLEVSLVPLPSLPSALATARARGINTVPLNSWLIKQGGARRLTPLQQLQASRAALDAEADAAVRRQRVAARELSARWARTIENALAAMPIPVARAQGIIEAWNAGQLDGPTALATITSEREAFLFRVRYATAQGLI